MERVTILDYDLSRRKPFFGTYTLEPHPVLWAPSKFIIDESIHTQPASFALLVWQGLN